jgi:hypothetical protein
MRVDAAYHGTRFTFDERRETLWKTLCGSYFNHLNSPDDTVLEMSVGYCNFINNIRAKRRIALDIWPGVAEAAHPGVRALVGSVKDLSTLGEDTVDFVFASNLFEHLTQSEFACATSWRRTISALWSDTRVFSPLTSNRDGLCRRC